MRLFLFVFLFLSFSAAAADGATGGEWTFGSFFTELENFYNGIERFVFEDIPQMIEDFKLWVGFWLLKIYFEIKLKSIELSFTLAQTLLSHFGFMSLFDSALSALPSDIKALISQYGLIRAINFIIEAYVARFILNLGWL